MNTTKHFSSQLASLTIFFPFFNDAGTVRKAIALAYAIGKQVTTDLEVIAIHGGNSRDRTWKEILKAKQRFPALKVINQSNNTQGYAVIKHGFAAATKDWVFYTDGDLQYEVRQLLDLVATQKRTSADVVNGWKMVRNDSAVRKLLGWLYQVSSGLLFKLPIRDIDCDFRLIRRSFLEKCRLKSEDSSVLAELLLELNQQRVVFAEIPVIHRHRAYGSSNFNPFKLCLEKIKGDLSLYFKRTYSHQT